MPALCRDCLSEIAPATRCPSCGGPRILAHPQLFDLSIDHLDADGLSAAIKKRTAPASPAARHPRRRPPGGRLRRLLRGLPPPGRIPPQAS